jgi:phosphatidylethanolamine-binding protein (PEBP) family uncharacterized protein
MAFQLTSTAFQQGQTIPKEYTADGRNTSPPLKWTEPPDRTRSLALVCEDPDAPPGTFSHWVAFNLATEQRELGEGGTLSGGAARRAGRERLWQGRLWRPLAAARQAAPLLLQAICPRQRSRSAPGIQTPRLAGGHEGAHRGRGRVDGDLWPIAIGGVPRARAGRLRAGVHRRLLKELLRLAGVPRGDFFITNTIRFRPPGKSDAPIYQLRARASVTRSPQSSPRDRSHRSPGSPR